MSEYQYIHFVACDRPLDDKQLAYMELQSTRADISRWEFTNEYHYSGFRGNAIEMLRRGYDMHLHFANFGIRKLMFRLPELPCDKKTFAAYEVGSGLTWTKDKRGKAGVLSIEPEEAWETYDYLDDVHSFLSRLAPLRDKLLQGDLRPLYLAWLACAYDDESFEPPVPVGLVALDDSLEALAEFYEVPSELLAAAADQSLPEPERTDRDVAAERWIRGLSKVELTKIVRDVVTGDAASVRSDLLDNIRQSSPVEYWPTTGPSRTLGELRAFVETVQEKREERERSKTAKARKRHLKSIAADPAKIVRQVKVLVTEKRSSSYEQAAEQLNDLAEALGPEKGPAKAKSIAEKLRRDKPHSRTLISELRKAGLLSR